MDRIDRPSSLCMAPWTHTYLSPQTERRMCCASREPAQNFRQYIDTASGTGEYRPITLEQHWNSDHMRSVRRRMMAGETLPECEVCNNRLLNTDVYRDYFWHLFKHRYDDIWNTTDDTGATTMRPVSWDYRFSNLCNFKCRHCGDMLSSAWESEQRQHDMINWQDPKNNWMRPEVRREISAFQDSQIEQEFAAAVERGDVEEIYWVGGEPLMYEQHWRYMQRIIELENGGKVYARYNTNLSRIRHRGIDLFKDILTNIRDWQICASLDGTAEIGEYIRDGLDYQVWRSNYQQGMAARRYPRQMRIDFTLTLPGMFEVENIQTLGKEFGSEILTKVIFSFSPDIVMSPLALPRTVLEDWIKNIVPNLDDGALKDSIVQLKSRPTFQEQWPDTWKEALIKGKQRVQRIESIRNSKLTMDEILKNNGDMHDWWRSIPC
jgi:sulfatase maturation enzyme AslB (radical SAM superfamily)